MSSDVRDLQTYWPFLPSATVDDAAANIVDARIVLHVGGNPRAAETNGDFVQVNLVQIHDAVAIIECSVEEAGISGILMEVAVVKDNAPSYPESYFVVREDVDISDFQWTGRLRVSPACVRVTQDLPTVSLQEKSGFHVTGEDGTVGDWIRFGDTLAIKGSLNVSTSYENGELSINGGDPPSGKYPPFVEINENTSVIGGRGLRSINGHTGDVTIEAKGEDVQVTTSQEGENIHILFGVKK